MSRLRKTVQTFKEAESSLLEFTVMGRYQIRLGSVLVNR